MRRLHPIAALATFTPLLLAACAGEPSDDFSGPGVAIDVAALNLAGVGDVVWDLQVDNGGGDVVWQRRVTSSGYGDSAGSASYVGPCDADPAVADNVVKVWVVGVYAADVTAAGSFASGSDQGVGAVTGTSVPFQNPTTVATPLTRTVTCREGQDAAVQFDVALMRPAQQGFFDIAVNFNDVFCSAKLDCEQAGGGDIELLFDATGARARTFVLGFACTAGDGDVDTQLYMSDLELDCTAPNDAASFVADLALRPDAPHNGNLCSPGTDGMSGCAGSVTEHVPGTVDADAYLFQLAVYRGEELLTTGGSAANKQYWNVALGVKASITGCRLRARATADDAGDPGDLVSGGTIAAGTVYPYVQWDVDLSACSQEELTFGDPAAPVRAAYTATDDAETTFAYPWAASLPPVCTATCANGGTCGAVDWCVCAAGWTGSTCEVPVCEPVCANGGSCTAPGTCDCGGTGFTGPTCEEVVPGVVDNGGVFEWGDGTYAASCYAYRNPGVDHTPATDDGLYRINPSGAGDFVVYCDMTSQSGGWTRVYYQDAAVGFFADNEFEKNKANPGAGVYAILGDLEYFRRGGSLELKMDWPGNTTFWGYQHWLQTSNPVTDTFGATPTGVVSIHIDYTSYTTGDSTWGGLQRNADGVSGPSLLDGTLAQNEWWYYAIGTKACWVGPAPNCQPGPDAPPAQIVELWVR